MATGSEPVKKDDGWQDYTQPQEWQDYSAPVTPPQPQPSLLERAENRVGKVARDTYQHVAPILGLADGSSFPSAPNITRQLVNKSQGKPNTLEQIPREAGMMFAFGPEASEAEAAQSPEYIPRGPMAEWGKPSGENSLGPLNEKGMLSATKDAVKDRRASMIPMRVKPEVPAPEPNPVAMTHDAGPLGRIGPPSRPAAQTGENLGAIPIPRPSHVLTDIPVRTPSQAEPLATAPIRAVADSSPLGGVGPSGRPAAAAGDALATLPRPIGGYQDMNRFLKSNPSPLGEIPVARTSSVMKPWPIPRTKGITFVPEPRPAFAGENEGYMASTPREELLGLAKMRKPGAGTQLQQIGKPIIYIPKEADLP